MKNKSIISWLDVIKLAIGIMIGVTPMLLIFMDYSVKEFKEEKKNVAPPKIEIEEKQDTVFVESLGDVGYVYTIDKIIEMRESSRHYLFLDSIYMAMPEDILRAILKEKGTNLEMEDLVKEYLNNKKKYHQVIKSK